MNLYLVSQDESKRYATYNSMVVAAESEAAARQIHPNCDEQWGAQWRREYSTWCSTPEKVKVRYIGKAGADQYEGIICASFSAG
jgi:hypothetical protein